MAHLPKLLSEDERAQAENELNAIAVGGDTRIARIRALVAHANIYGWVRGAVVSEIDQIVAEAIVLNLKAVGDRLRGGAGHPLT